LTYLLLLERVPEIVDVRESWPILDINSTLRLCSEFGVSHPKHDIFPEPISLDFLITETASEGVTFRAVALVENPARITVRNQRLKQVAQQWCDEHGIGWSLVGTSALDRTVLDSLRFIRGWYRHRVAPDSEIAFKFAKLFMDHYQNNLVLSEVVDLVVLDQHNAASRILPGQRRKSMRRRRTCCHKRRDHQSVVRDWPRHSAVLSAHRNRTDE
jgi:hypothetical protein